MLRKTIAHMEPEEQRILLHNIAGGYQPSAVKSKWSNEREIKCELRGEADTAPHRLLRCKATAEARNKRPQAIQILQQRQCWQYLLLPTQHPDTLSLSLHTTTPIRTGRITAVRNWNTHFLHRRLMPRPNGQNTEKSSICRSGGARISKRGRTTSTTARIRTQDNCMCERTPDNIQGGAQRDNAHHRDARKSAVARRGEHLQWSAWCKK